MSVDTLTLAQRLRAAELPANQAEAIAAAIGAAVLEGAATKADVETARAATDGKIEQVRTEIEQVRTEIERSRHQVLVGFISTQVAIAGLIVAAIKLF